VLRSKFLYNEQRITVAEEKIADVIGKITASVKTSDSYGKELALHDYLVKNASYEDYGVGATTVAGALLSKKAICEGYAKAFKMLCDYAGLSCIVVSGSATNPYGGDELHAWNIVKINGICSHIDVTWDSTTRGEREYCRDHFNLTDEDAAKDRVWDKSLLPSCNSSKYNYYIRNGQCVNGLSEFKEYFISHLQQGEKIITVRILGKEIKQEAVMKTIEYVLRETMRFGFSVNLQYNEKRGIAWIKLI